MGLLREFPKSKPSVILDGDDGIDFKDITPRKLRSQEKAAVIVRLLLGQGVSPGVKRLEARHQTQLAHVISRLGNIDRATLAEVVRDFTDRIDNLALSFPDSLSETLALMEPHLAPGPLDQLRAAAEKTEGNDPWARVSKQGVERLRPLMDSESAEVCAVLLSKLSVSKAAALLADLPDDRAQILAHTVALTETVSPEVADRIGFHVAGVLEAVPPKAFQKSAAERVGAILNSTPQAARDKVLEGLEGRNAIFAKDVRKSIFSFGHIPMRLEPMDVPLVIRKADATALTTALAAGLASAPLSVEFLLENMSKRMAEQLRDDAETRGTPKPEEGEGAMADIVGIIRDLEAAGEIKLLPPPD